MRELAARRVRRDGSEVAVLMRRIIRLLALVAFCQHLAWDLTVDDPTQSACTRLGAFPDDFAAGYRSRRFPNS